MLLLVGLYLRLLLRAFIGGRLLSENYRLNFIGGILQLYWRALLADVDWRSFIGFLLVDIDLFGGRLFAYIYLRLFLFAFVYLLLLAANFRRCSIKIQNTFTR